MVKDKRGREIKTVYVQPDIYAKFKATCVHKGMKMNHVFETLMKRYIRENKFDFEIGKKGMDFEVR